MFTCEICGKKANHGRKISIARSHVSRRAKKKQKPNIQRIKVIDNNGTVKHQYICTRCLRSGKVTRAQHKNV